MGIENWEAAIERYDFDANDTISRRAFQHSSEHANGTSINKFLNKDWLTRKKRLPCALRAQKTRKDAMIREAPSRVFAR